MFNSVSFNPVSFNPVSFFAEVVTPTTGGDVYRRTAHVESGSICDRLAEITARDEFAILATVPWMTWASSEWHREAEPRAFLSAAPEKLGRSIAQMQKRVTMETVSRGIDERTSLTI